MSSKSKIIIGVCSVFVVFAVILTVYLCWPAIEGTINGSRYYTEDDVQGAYDKGYNDGITNKDELIAQVEAYKLLIEQNEITISDLNNQIEILTKQNQEYAGANETLNQSVSTLQNQISDLQSDISDLEDEIVSKQEQISNLQKQLLDLQKDNDSNLSTIISLNTQIANLESDIENLNNTITNYTGTINSLNFTINSLNSQIEDLEESQQLLQSQVNSLTSQITEYQQEIENYESIIETLQRENYATVIFKIENEVVSTQSIKKGTHPANIEDERLNEDTFKGWVIENTTDIVDPYTYNIENNVTFVAKFEKTYTVTFKVANSIVDTQSVNAGQYATNYVVSDTEEYVFDCWTVNGVKVDNVSSYPINKDTEFVAVLKYYKSVTYQVEGQEDHVIKVLEGNQIEESYIPTFTKNEYFLGWKLNNEIVDPTALIINDNIILIADINYINNSFEVISSVTYKTSNDSPARLTFDFSIEDNVLKFNNLKIEFFVNGFWIVPPFNINFNFIDYVDFSFESQELNLDIPLSETPTSGSVEETYLSLLESNGESSFIKFKLEYDKLTNSWELKEFKEYISLYSVMSINQGNVPTFELGESQTIIKEN